ISVVRLSTIIVHEMGRPLGLQETPNAVGVMAMTFQTGERVLPNTSDLGGSRGLRVDPTTGLPLINLPIPVFASGTVQWGSTISFQSPIIAQELRAIGSATGWLIAQTRATDRVSRLFRTRAVSQAFGDLDSLQRIDALVDQLARIRSGS